MREKSTRVKIPKIINSSVWTGTVNLTRAGGFPIILTPDIASCSIALILTGPRNK